MTDWFSRHAQALRYPSKAGRVAIFVLCIVGFIFSGLSWSLASAPGGSPDDDYHLASISCPDWPKPVPCKTRVHNGQIEKQVPGFIAEIGCYAAKAGQSAACLKPATKVSHAWRARYDRGEYPRGYYQFHHLIAGNQVYASIVPMRMVNFSIALVLLGLLLWFSPARLRPAFFLATLGAWVPMGLFLIASNNPSSWAITGTAVYALGLYAAIQSEGRNRVVLAVLSAVGAVLCFTSRGDAAFYVLVCSLAVWILNGEYRKNRKLLVYSLIASVLGLVVMFSSGQSGNINADHTVPGGPKASALGKIFSLTISAPRLFFGLWGIENGPGWLDVKLSYVEAASTMIVLAIIVAFGIGSMTRRKFLALVIVLGAILGIPFVMLFRRGDHLMQLYQSRYVLPLLVLALFILLLPTAKQLLDRVVVLEILAVALMIAAALSSLYSVIQRFVVGMDKPGAGLNPALGWWWDIPLLPKVLWLLGALGFFVGASLAYWLSKMNSSAIELPRNKAAAK